MRVFFGCYEEQEPDYCKSKSAPLIFRAGLRLFVFLNVFFYILK